MCIRDRSNGRPLPGSINDSGNANYPFVMADGVTIYYASDGEGLLRQRESTGKGAGGNE